MDKDYARELKRKIREIHDELTNIWPQLDEQHRQQAMQQLRRATSIMEGLAEKSTPGLSKQEWSAVDGQVRWSRLFGQFFRFDEWNLCRG